jgi:hypothetical protein
VARRPLQELNRWLTAEVESAETDLSACLRRPPQPWHYLDTSGIAHGFTAQLCDPDISSQFKIAASGFLLNHTTGEFTQQIVVTNTSGQPIAGPLLIVFKNLPGPVIMDNGNQLSVCAAPGAPYLTVNPPGGSLMPGQSVQATANFANYSNGAITYTPAVLSGSGGTIP